MTTLGLIEKAFGHSRINEACARWIVNSVILDAYETTTSTIKNAQPLSVQCERGYKFGPVTLNRQKVVLSGRPDYSVWYGESEALCLNVLVVEAETKKETKDPSSLCELKVLYYCQDPVKFGPHLLADNSGHECLDGRDNSLGQLIPHCS